MSNPLHTPQHKKSKKLTKKEKRLFAYYDRMYKEYAGLMDRGMSHDDAIAYLKQRGYRPKV